MMRQMGWFITVVATVVLLGGTGYRTVAHINYDRYCEGYLKNAADANSVEQAQERLAIAVKYINDHKLNDGFTSIFLGNSRCRHWFLGKKLDRRSHRIAGITCRNDAVGKVKFTHEAARDHLG